MRILSIFGTRPEAIKMAPVVRELERRKEIESLICVTAQHRQMLDAVLKAFAIRPDFDLDIMRPAQTLCGITTAALTGLDGVIDRARPDLVLVHGDTSTTLAGALAAFYHQVPIGHVEAGLRTGEKYRPFPEEMNRQLTDRLCDLCFAPTERSRDHLLRENIPAERIVVTGNTAIDALAVTVRPDFSHPALDWAGENRLILLTAHRRENLGAPLRRIFRAVRRLAERFDDVRVICPVHLNPAVRQAAKEELSGCARVRLIEPPDAPDFHNLLARAYLVLTDSGGIQEEAPALGKPVLVLRDTTERPEGLEAGTLRLVGTGEEGILHAAEELLQDPEAYARMSRASNPYGDGHASRRIADAILARFG
ncbi:MAG: UDP-N-acetylglucosamine 2-epimerase (non-hydrolyzing) [Oscillospiraceae bacterium]|nr:UDP-N-acetylglucosamine 2-epimerase (non-hydrolyzing) [Oscillospiraceae bacterium]